MKNFRILCIRCDRIGDLLVSTPVMHRLRRLYPDAEIRMVTSPAGRLALIDNPDVDEVLVYDKRSPRSWSRVLSELLRPHDMVIGFNAQSVTIRFLTALARGARKGLLQTGKYAPWRGAPEEEGHISACLLRELEMEFELPHDESPDMKIRFHVPENLKQSVSAEYPAVQGLKRIGLFIGNMAQDKLRWPIEKFAELAAILLEKNPGVELYAVAGIADAPLLDELETIEDGRFHTFIGNVSLQHTAAFISTCDAFVTSSSAPQHLAASVGLPMVSIVHPRSNVRWSPRGPLCFSAVSDIEYDVRGVTVEQVYEALAKAMQGMLSPWKA